MNDEVKMNYEWTANRICGGLFVYIWGRQRAIVRKNQGKNQIRNESEIQPTRRKTIKRNQMH